MNRFNILYNYRQRCLKIDAFNCTSSKCFSKPDYFPFLKLKSLSEYISTIEGPIVLRPQKDNRCFVIYISIAKLKCCNSMNAINKDKNFKK